MSPSRLIRPGLSPKPARRCSTWPSGWTCGSPPPVPATATAANVSSRSPGAANCSAAARRRRPICRATSGFPAAQPSRPAQGQSAAKRCSAARFKSRSTALACRASTSRRRLARRSSAMATGCCSTARKSTDPPARFMAWPWTWAPPPWRCDWLISRPAASRLASRSRIPSASAAPTYWRG